VAACLLTLLAAPAVAANAEVHIVGGAPNPAEITVDSGDLVTFFNDDDVEHTIFAAGQPRGDAIAPHSGAEFGPFDTGGERGTFAYRVDQSGPAGVVIVRGQATTSAPASTAPASTAPPETTATTTTVTAPTATTGAAPTTVAFDSSTTVTNEVKSGGKDSSNLLAVLGFALLVAGIGGLVVVLERTRRRRRAP
jgi:plastocyanin